ncbi:MAG: hypothetical protein IPI64_08990 [Chloracidobacterium sp.]|nr:hypothetical protein [Chloracidobacterium sp.]
MRIITSILFIFCLVGITIAQTSSKKDKDIEKTNIQVEGQYALFVMPVYYSYLIRLDTYTGEAVYLRRGLDNDTGTWNADSAETLIWTAIKGGPPKTTRLTSKRRYSISTVGGRAILFDVDTGNAWATYVLESVPEWKPFNDNRK